MSSIISLVIWWLKRPNKSRASKSHCHQYKNNIHRTKQRRREQQTLTTSIMMLDSVISMVCRWRSPPAWLIKNDLAECLNGKVPEVNNLKSTHVRVNKTYVYFLILFRFEKEKKCYCRSSYYINRFYWEWKKKHLLFHLHNLGGRTITFISINKELKLHIHNLSLRDSLLFSVSTVSWTRP